MFIYELFEIRLPISRHTCCCYSLIRIGRKVGMQRVTNLCGKSSGISLRAAKILECDGMRKLGWWAGFVLALCGAAQAQWQMQDSHTTADLRGIHNVGGVVAWASGTNGTVLRTEDGGYLWQTCTVPPGAEHLDFRGIQAFDANTAIVMSSGKGDLSRLYRTTDGCQTWKLVFTNPDKVGFWDAIVVHQKMGLLVGDPVDGRFAIFSSSDGQLDLWTRFGETSDFKHFRFEPSPYEGEQLFAASNSIVKGSPMNGVGFVTGGP